MILQYPGRPGEPRLRYYGNLVRATKGQERVHYTLYTAICRGYLAGVQIEALSAMRLARIHAEQCGLAYTKAPILTIPRWSQPARPSNVLAPRYKWKKRMPKLHQTMRPGTDLGNPPTLRALKAHRTYNEYMMQRLIKRMVRTPAREMGAVVSVPLSLPKWWKVNGTVIIRQYQPRVGTFSKIRESMHVATSRHYAENFIGSLHTTRNSSKIHRLAAIVRYSSQPKGTRSLKEEACVVREIVRRLGRAVESFDFPETECNVLIRGTKVRSSLTPFLWHDKEKEVHVSKHRFIFPNVDAIQHAVNTHAVAEAFITHVSGHVCVCRDLNLNPAYLLVGVDAMGCR